MLWIRSIISLLFLESFYVENSPLLPTVVIYLLFQYVVQNHIQLLINNSDIRIEFKYHRRSCDISSSSLCVHSTGLVLTLHSVCVQRCETMSLIDFQFFSLNHFDSQLFNCDQRQYNLISAGNPWLLNFKHCGESLSAS